MGWEHAEGGGGVKLETMTLATLNTLKEGCLPFPCVHVLGMQGQWDLVG